MPHNREANKSGDNMRYVILVVLILSVIIPTTNVLAAPAEDAEISIQSIHAFRNVAEDGDMLVVFHWRWASDNLSDIPASSAVSISLSYNGTRLAGTTPYVYLLFDNNGYGDGMSSFYLSANSSPIWQGDYGIQIAGLPAYFSPPPIFTYDMLLADFVDADTQEENQDELKTYILNECDIFKTIYPDVSLKSTSDVGVVLSSYGEAYFTSVIQNLIWLCPGIFFAQVHVPETMPVQDYDMSLQTTLTGQIAGTDLERGSNRIGDYIGVTGSVIWGILTVILCLYIAVKCFKKGWGLEIALFIDGVVVTGMALVIGDLIFTIVMIGSLLAVMGISWVLFGKRAL